MKIKRPMFFLLLLFFVSSSGLWAQSDSTGTSTYFDMSGFPLWAKDLRRWEIIAVGSFPILYLWVNNIPWPIGVKEQTRVLQVTAGGAVLLAFVDYGIMLFKRNRLKRESQGLQEGAPVIIRTPLYGEEEGVSEPAPESP